MLKSNYPAVLSSNIWFNVSAELTKSWKQAAAKLYQFDRGLRLNFTFEMFPCVFLKTSTFAFEIS